MPTAGRLGPKTVMNNIHVKLPEGKTAEVSPGLKIQDFMSTLELNGTVIAAKLDGLLVDLDRSLSEDCTLDWIPLNSPEGLSILRHSTAHLLAQAVQSLFPGTQVTIGPTIEDGFYYDFKRDKSFTPEEIGKIEAQMQKLAGLDLKVTREEMPKEEAIKLFHQMGEEYKVAILTDINDLIHHQGNWMNRSPLQTASWEADINSLFSQKPLFFQHPEFLEPCLYLFLKVTSEPVKLIP